MWAAKKVFVDSAGDTIEIVDPDSGKVHAATLFNTEHAPVEIAQLQALLQAAAVGTARCGARPA